MDIYIFVYILYFIFDCVLWLICLIKRRGRGCMYVSVLLRFDKMSKDVESAENFDQGSGQNRSFKRSYETELNKQK